MKSPSILTPENFHGCDLASSDRNRGFTLIEILVVVSILALFTVLGLSFSFDSYRSHLFRSEYTLTANLLAKARNRAINNFNQSPHGVYIDADAYILFVGADFSSSDPSLYERFPRNKAFRFVGPDQVVFKQLSGDLKACELSGSVQHPCEISFSYASRTKTIAVNAVGGIVW